MSTATPPGDDREGPEERYEEPRGGSVPGPSDAPTGEAAEGSAGASAEGSATGSSDEGSPRGEVDVDAAWAQIMAHWNEPAVDPGTRHPARPGRHRRAEGLAPGDPGDPAAPPAPSAPPGELRRRRTDRVSPPPPVEPPSLPPRPAQPPRGLPDGRGGTESDPLGEEHYVPPEPPPLPRAGWRTWLPWVGVLGVPLFFVVVVVLRPSLPSEVVLVAVLGFVAGFLTLVLRLPTHRDDDGDDGARV